LSTASKIALQGGSPIYLASITVVEVRYLTEKGRIPEEALQRLDRAIDEADSALRLVALDRDIARALYRIPRGIVPDMPDRIIAATALHLGVPLVTRDAAIRAAPITTIW
jgi:predicted nucleic acid-binding protein